MCRIFSSVYENWYFEDGETYICGHLGVILRCYFAFVLPIIEYCSPVCGLAAEFRLQLLERRVYSVARLCPDQTFLLLCHRHHVAALYVVLG